VSKTTSGALVFLNAAAKNTASAARLCPAPLLGLWNLFLCVFLFHHTWDGWERVSATSIRTMSLLKFLLKLLERVKYIVCKYPVSTGDVAYLQR
jgi:hypothetical protein